MSSAAPVAHWYQQRSASDEADRLHIAPLRRARLTDLRMEGYEMYCQVHGDGTTTLLQKIPGPVIEMSGWEVVERPANMRRWHKLA
jgi:hypothetical protein